MFKLQPALLLKIIVCFLIYSKKALGQSSEINLKNFNEALTEKEFIKRLNEHRASKNLSVLTADPILKKAAKDQSEYQLKIHQLTHQQKVKQKETPTDRVFFYNGTHGLVGENCIKIPLKSAFKPKYKKSEIIVNTYEELGEALFLGWKNSPGHYKNMIEPGYDVSGFSYSLDNDSSYIYCTQVFAAKPFLPEPDFVSPADAYGIKAPLKTICDQLQSKEGKNAIGNIHFVFEGDSIFLRSEDLKALTTFFNQAQDGLYFDLVQRKQFTCDKNLLLHGSPIFDGKMLKPIWFKDLFKKNQVKDGKNFYAAICQAPKQLQNNDIRLNYGIIKNGSSCDYTYMVEVPDENLRMLNLYPKWIYSQNIELKPDSFEGNLSFTVPFERGETRLTDKKIKELSEKLEIYKPFITDLYLQTYSSIEGNTQINIKLQQERANSIISIIKKFTTIEPKLTKQTSENWDEFRVMIEKTPLNYLNKLNNEKVKEKIKSKPLLDSLDYLLRINRTAQLTISIKAKVDNNSNPYLLLGAYQKSLKSGDSLKSFHQQNKILSYLITNDFKRGDLLPIEIPKTKKFLPHLTNYLVIAVKDDELIYNYQAKNLAKTITDIDSNYLPVKFNTCIMAIRYLHEFGDTIIPIQKLEKSMEQCFKLNNYDDSVIVNHMHLNFHLLSLHNNWSLRRYEKINHHLLKVKEFYPGANISDEEAIKLGLLFNMYARYNWTQDLLYTYLKNNSKNEDLLFLFIQTYGGFKNGKLSEKEFEKYLLMAKEKNVKRFYDWVNERNFQLLRDATVKKIFCSIKL